MANYLNLNKNKTKKCVVLKLKTLGYDVSDDTTIREIQEIIKVIQKDNGLIADGHIGARTMPLLGYSTDEICKLLNLSKNSNNFSRRYPMWLLFH